MAANKKNTTCPYCKEEIKAGAVKCKHCSSKLGATLPAHEGTCPFCKEDIHAEAIKCKHCKSNLTAAAETGCGCQNKSGDEISTILRQIRVGNGSISGGDLKCALEYLDCIEGPLGGQPGLCEGLQTACRLSERAIATGGSRVTRGI